MRFRPVRQRAEGRGIASLALPLLIATYIPFCTPAVRPTMLPWDAPLASLWQQPVDLPERDLLYGPWGAENAPDPSDRYTLVELKHSGSNPGMTVRDTRGRQWSVKQAPFDRRASEGPIEVVMSRVLSAVGYHQPPVYFLPSFRLVDDWGAHVEPGGRFRLKVKTLRDRGEWSWQQNPFVGMRPYQGLLVTLLLLNSSDFKNSNNTVYDHQTGDRVEQWYVVRDLGTALGDTGRMAPRRGNLEEFERHPFTLDVGNGFVRFAYRGWHQELIRGRLTPMDVGWACDQLADLSDDQWHAAFRAGGFPDDVAAAFIRQIQNRIKEGLRIGGDDWRHSPPR